MNTIIVDIKGVGNYQLSSWHVKYRTGIPFTGINTNKSA
jgi:hypothetical protein